MTERTYNIIMACKKAKDGDVTNAVKKYMSKECDVPIEYYTQSEITRIMQAAMYDYLDTCDKPSVFMNYFFEWYNHYGYNVSFGEQVARAFKVVQVRNRDGNYINGFGEWAEREENK